MSVRVLACCMAITAWPYNNIRINGHATAHNTWYLTKFCVISHMCQGHNWIVTQGFSSTVVVSLLNHNKRYVVVVLDSRVWYDIVHNILRIRVSVAYNKVEWYTPCTLEKSKTNGEDNWSMLYCMVDDWIATRSCSFQRHHIMSVPNLCVRGGCSQHHLFWCRLELSGVWLWVRMSKAGCSDIGVCGNEGAVATIKAVRNVGTICVEQRANHWTSDYPPFLTTQSLHSFSISNQHTKHWCCSIRCVVVHHPSSLSCLHLIPVLPSIWPCTSPHYMHAALLPLADTAATVAGVSVMPMDPSELAAVHQAIQCTVLVPRTQGECTWYICSHIPLLGKPTYDFRLTTYSMPF